MMEGLCCNPLNLCRAISDCCSTLTEKFTTTTSPELKRSSFKIRKEDIQYLIDRQPTPTMVGRFDSVVSRTSVCSSSTTCSAQNSPRSPHSGSFRERVDSDRSQDGSSRFGSCSSGSEYRKFGGNMKPVIDVRPIEFWTANKEQVGQFIEFKFELI